ncbi:MAG TPA: sporulation transcriptional regulator SpoIIID [Candidatus Pullichristensenella stercorigallinarum]|uniref:Sporulation transcriptional regulator SpoIIID n=1 Tax=Candidatus Pullichristensenella stercorigallinarum TaxID=2840909 RepID=A0A9D0ZNJ4_9FIRM|nr:sporulation transcriptional regulator SpoIIID [Candidatus Pullichristensenella stercorigallinarum]
MRVKREIYIRVTDAARHILATGATVRQCAERFGVSKTTIHKDMRKRLKEIDPGLFAEVSAVLDKNRRERHLRGGMATRRKYERRREGTLSG